MPSLPVHSTRHYSECEYTLKSVIFSPTETCYTELLGPELCSCLSSLIYAFFCCSRKVKLQKNVMSLGFFVPIYQSLLGEVTVIFSINPLSLHDAIKHHFTSLKTDIIFLQTKVSEQNFHGTWLPMHGTFLYFFTHIKSSSSTTSRELRQQFAACSG